MPSDPKRADEPTGGTRPAQEGAFAREIRVRADSHPNVVLLRHGEPDWSPGGGPSVNDPGLTAFGRAQARAAAERLAQRPLDAIYVSPYQRARETAAPLAEFTGLEPIVMDGLAEIGVAVEGLSQEDVDRYFVEASRRPLHELWDGWPGAETFHDFHGRVTDALRQLLARHGMTPRSEGEFTVWSWQDAAPHVAIVAHGGTNAVALSHLLDVRPVPWEWLRFESELASYSVVHARSVGPDAATWSLQHFGVVRHLVEHGLRK
jgi:probable phosphoglycerate mutase